MLMKTEFEIIIVGAGLVGLTTALACAHSGAQVALLDRAEITGTTDGRASALSTTSLRLFENLGIDLSEKLQPIREMLVTEGAPDSPWRLRFEGDGDGGDLGALIENHALKSALAAKIEEIPEVRIFAPITVENFERNGESIRLRADGNDFTAKLLIAADGHNSLLRRKAGITVQRFDYDAESLVTTISHELPHDGLAWQRIIKGGALAILPLLDNRSQIVWSGPSTAIAAAVQLPEKDFLTLLSEKMGGYLGDMRLVAPRQSYPLRLQVADSFLSDRVALVGDAAHVIHPLAGQGLNLGLRDAAALADGVKTALSTGQDIGVISLLDYDLWRNADTRQFGLLTHLISEISGAKSGVFGHVRRLGMTLTNGSSVLTSALAKRASGEGPELPALMQRY